MGEAGEAARELPQPHIRLVTVPAALQMDVSKRGQVADLLHLLVFNNILAVDVERRESRELCQGRCAPLQPEAALHAQLLRDVGAAAGEMERGERSELAKCHWPIRLLQLISLGEVRGIKVVPLGPWSTLVTLNGKRREPNEPIEGAQRANVARSNRIMVPQP